MHYKWILVTLLFFTALLASEDMKLPTHIIHFTGQKHFDEAVLQDALGVERKSFFEFWKEDTPRIKDKLLPTLKLSLKSFYDSEGFYDARFTIKETHSTVDVTIEENLPVKINDITISSDYDLSALVTVKSGEIFRAKDFMNIKKNIIQALLKDGYCSYDLDTKAYVDLDKHKVDLKYLLKKGGICTFGDVTVKGLKSIDKEVVGSRVRAAKGEKFNTELIKDTYDALYGLDAFDSILVKYDRKFYNVVPVDITVSEIEKSHYYRMGAGYDTFVGLRVQAEYIKKNFLGNAQKFKSKAAWSSKEQLVELEFFKPAFFNILDYYIDLGLKTGYSNLEFEGFLEEKTHGKIFLAYTDKKLILRSGLALESIYVSLLDNMQGNPLSHAINEGTFLLFYPYIHMIYDERDSKLNPKYGYYLSAYLEYGLAYDNKASDYIKTLFEGRIIHTFGDLTLAAVGKAGFIEGTSAQLPESKLFFAGGSFSNRAYGYNEMGVIISPSEYSIQGAMSMANLSFEADYPVWGNLYGAVFTDNTMLSAENYDLSGEIISSAGVGVRYMTPIGPFKLDIGFNIDDPSQYGIQFQIGQSF
jgi:translocation and assembly module TamA